MKVLFVASRFPYPPLRGDQVRAHHQLRLLSARHDVTVVCAEPGPAERVPCRELVPVKAGLPSRLTALARGLLAGRPAQAAWFEAGPLRRTIRERLARGRFDLVHVQLARLAGVAPPGLPRVVDLIDALSLNMARRGRRDRGPLAWAAAFEAPRLRAWELRVCADYDRATVVSEADRGAIGDFPSLSVNPNGVDLAAWAYSEADRVPGRVVFTGNLGYFPNVDAVAWFAAEVLPRLGPDARFEAAGARPAPALLELARRDPRVAVRGPVEHLSEVLGRAAVAVAPLRAGSGQLLKVLEAMASGAALVATPQALAGIAAEPGVHALVAESPADFAAAVARLLSDPGLGRGLARAARTLVEERYSWERSVAGMETVWHEAARAG